LLAGRAVSASTIKTKRLREDMTGQVKKTRAVAVRRKWVLPAIVTAVVGALALLVVIGGYWFLASNPGMISAVASPMQQASPPLTTPPRSTLISPSETIQAVMTAISTSLPTEAPLPAEIRDAKNVSMSLISAGEFTMGSDDAGDAGSRPAHTVYVEAFYIDKYEVTNEMYDVCAYAVECRKPLQTGSVTRTTYYNNPVFANYPVIYLDWKMAKAYCEWRGARLPTEAEWEKTARGTDERIYPWGSEEFDCSYANFSGCVGDTSPVDQHVKGLSPYDVYGMAGNVWEWTSTIYKLYPYSSTDNREDLEAPGKRVARGGSWHLFGGNSGNVRTDTRFEVDPGYYGAYVGVRCALSVDPE